MRPTILPPSSSPLLPFPRSRLPTPPRLLVLPSSVLSPRPVPRFFVLSSTATSSVTVTSSECERLLLDEKFALGQIFRHLRTYPEFALLKVDAHMVNGLRELRRTYKLETEGIRCEIEEVFPDRNMFDMGEAWLNPEVQENQSGTSCHFDGFPAVDGLRHSR